MYVYASLQKNKQTNNEKEWMGNERERRKKARTGRHTYELGGQRETEEEKKDEEISFPCNHSVVRVHHTHGD